MPGLGAPSAAVHYVIMPVQMWIILEWFRLRCEGCGELSLAQPFLAEWLWRSTAVACVTE